MNVLSKYTFFEMTALNFDQSICSEFGKKFKGSFVMKQSLAHIKHNIEELNSLFIKHCDALGKSQIQKISSSAHMVCLQTRVPGQTYYIYLGRGQDWEGMWWSQQGLKAESRVQDKFLAYLRSRLKGVELKSLVSDVDRFVGIHYRKGKEFGLMGFFYGQPKLVFIDVYTEQGMVCTFCPALSLKIVKNKIDTEINLLKIATFSLSSLGYKKLEMPSSVEDFEKKNSFIQDYINKNDSEKAMAPTKKGKFIKRKVENIRKDLAKVNKWKDISKMLMSESFDVKDLNLIYENVKIFVGHDQNRFKAKDRIFEKIKNFKKAEGFLEERLKNTIENKIEEKEQVHSSEEVITPYWNMFQKLNVKNEESKDYWLFEVKGIKGGIGKNAKGNDQLRAKWANKEDTWIHLEGYHGPHVILKTDNILSVEDRVLQSVIGMLVEKNDLEIKEASVIYCPVKQLKGVKGQAGKVIYNKAKYLRVECNRDWREIISIDDKL
jgi:predicted ribosome quality control (RQC) complex YloA/Tae2 family protein